MREDLKKLAENFWVTGQLTPDDVKAAAADGFGVIINNRPDGEMIGQPAGAAIEAAAKAAGLRYAHLPVGPEGITPAMLSAFDALETDAAKTLAFCRTGMRSALLRAYAQARAGRAGDEIVAEARQAGFDISAHRQALQTLGAGAAEGESDAGESGGEKPQGKR